jgi:thiamine-phosphate pyrophosphorylase
MRPRQPRLFLMTDARMGDALWSALDRLPRGAGIVFRHYGVADRRALYERVRRIARRRGLLLLLAASPREAVGWKADGAHGRSPHRRAARPLLRTAPAHDRREWVAARGADRVFVSPIFATRSHVGGRALGPVRAGLLIGRDDRRRAVALGGMTPQRARRLSSLGLEGWAAIDAWTG